MSVATDRLRIQHVQPMSLGLFGHRDADLGTALQYSVSRLAAAQASLGDDVQVHLIASARPGSVFADGVRYVFHRGAGPPVIAGHLGPFGRQVSGGLLRSIRPNSADVVHFHGVRQFHLMYAAIAWRARRAGIPLVAQDRGGRGAWRLEVAAQRYGLRSSSAVLAASRACAVEVAELGAAAESVAIVPNGADPQVFFPVDRSPPRPDEPLRLLLVSRLVEHKDPMTMAAAAVELVRRGISVHATVVSRGPLRGDMEECFSAGGVASRFIDYLPQRELAEEYRRADVALLTTRLAGVNEGWNQVSLEAMACGVPLVATDIPGVRDCVGDGGMLVPVENPSAIADAVERLARDPERWMALRASGLRRAEGFNWTAIARYVREVYEAVLVPGRRMEDVERMRWVVADDSSRGAT